MEDSMPSGRIFRDLLATCNPRYIAVSVALVAFQAHAFNINPLERPDLDHGPFSWFADKVSQPVHETMTMLAYDCHARPHECEGSPQNFDRLKDGKRLAFLVNGVEWNDDPSLKLIGNILSVKDWVF